MSRAETSRRWCVFAAAMRDATGRWMGCGDGITRPSRTLYVVTETQAQAEAQLAKLMAGEHMQRARIPGDGHLWPQLEIEEFDPLDFVGAQRRGGLRGKRLQSLYGDLCREANANRAELMGEVRS